MSPIKDGSRSVIGAVEVFSNVTAQKKIEKRAGELENLAYCDALTGVRNRRYVELRVKQAIQETVQFGRKSGLILMDVDHFKQVNDNYGHDTGDDALRAVCRTLTSTLRSQDIVGRWGGEEFIAIVTDLNSVTLNATGERCRC